MMKTNCFSPTLIALLLGFSFHASADNAPSQPAGAYYGAFREVPVTDIAPQGWLKEFLERQRDGLGLNYAVSGYPFNNTLWVGPPVNDWGRYEEDAYLLDGIYRCGLLIDSKPLTDLGLANIHYVLDHPQANGQLGPVFPDLLKKKEIGTPAWPFAIFSRMLIAYYGATGDQAVLDALTAHYLSLPADFGSSSRDVNNTEIMCWVYGQTGDHRVLDIAERTWANFTKNPRSQWNLDRMKAGTMMKGHGVSVCEATKQPAVLYLYTGKQKYLDASLGAFKSLERDHEMVDGVISSDEGLNGKRPEGVHETCDITDYTWSLGYLLEASGDAAWGDKVELAIFNAGFGALGKDFKSHQYFSSPNQMVSNNTCSAPKFGPANADRQAYRPGFAVQCCTGNVHRMIPNYAARLWMTDGQGGIAATLYAPSVLKMKAGADATPVTIEETTDYPFEGAIDLKFTMEKPTQFPLYVRIPGWAEGATVTINGTAAEGHATPGTFLKLDRTFAPGDVVKLNFPMKVRMEAPVAESLSLLRGPLVYSLKIKEDRTARNDLKHTGKGFPAWDIAPASPWNYALDIKGTDDLAKVKVETRPVTDFPWTVASSPVVLTVPAHQVQGWTLTGDGFNPPLPAQPLQLAANAEQVELVPDGATQLRVSVFPAEAASTATTAPAQ